MNIGPLPTFRSARRITTSAAALAIAVSGLTGCLGNGNTTNRAAIGGGDTPVNLNDGSQRTQDVDPDSLLTQAERDAEYIRQYNENRGKVSWNDAQGAATTPPPSSDIPRTRPEDIAFTQQQPEVRSANANLRNGAPTTGNDTNQGTLAQNPPVTLEPIEKPDAATSTDDAASIPAAPTTHESRLEQLMVDLTRELRHHAADADSPLGDHLAAAALAMVDPSRVIPPENLYDLTDREREIFAQVQSFFASLGESIRASEEDIDTIMLSSIDALREELNQEPPLTIAEAQLCLRVKGFGDFTPFSANRFLAMEEQKAIVYIELENYTSEPTNTQEWKTELSQELSIYAERDGLLVWSEPWQRVVDTSKRQRSDFFTAQSIQFPRALTVGKYYLKIRLRDEATGALAEHSIPFEMVADPSMIGK